MKTYIVNIVFIIITNLISKLNIFIESIFHKGDCIIDPY